MKFQKDIEYLEGIECDLSQATNTGKGAENAYSRLIKRCHEIADKMKWLEQVDSNSVRAIVHYCDGIIGKEEAEKIIFKINHT